MNRILAITPLIVGSAFLTGNPALAAVTYNADITPNVIMGTGITNGAWTVDRSGGVELGLRAKVRLPSALNTFNSNGDGTYSFATGGSGSRPLWNFEWSINSGYLASTSAVPLSTYTYKLEIDSDPSAGIAFIGLDPINSQPYFDHSFGNNGTAESAGVEAPFGDASAYANNVATYNVAQNSWASHWFDAGFNPNIDGTYDFALTAYDRQGVQVAKTGMQVIVGQGGSSVPDAGSTLALLGFGVLGLGSLARRFNS